MITLVLYFALGFLSAVFLAALVAPAFWRRAVMLTRRRIEASVPLTTDEIRAEHDGLRAQHAIQVSKLEMELKAANERATAAATKHARGRKDIKSAADERATAKTALSDRENELREAREELRKRQARIDALTAALEKTESLLQSQRESYDALGKQFEEASMSSSARQIELVARETEISQLVNDISALKGKRRSTDIISRDADSRVKAADDAIMVERRRSAELNTKLLQLLATLSDREERLERREREITRLRERLRPIITAPADETYDLHVADLAAENVRLEAELAQLTEHAENGVAPAASAPKQAAASTQKLRQQMSGLAAQVVAMTAALEGPDSPIKQIINKPGVRDAQQPSLADHIRALQEAAVTRG